MEKNYFNVIAGYEEEKNRLISIADAFKNKNKVKEIGAKLPRGLLLLGDNGLGKTKLAEAFIKMSNTNVVTVNTNDDDEEDKLKKYLSSKFEEAKKKLPCIVYIDEVDKIAGNPENFYFEDNNKKSRILLNELNKISSIEGIFILMVANTKYSLDPSLIRSGRIDYVVTIEKPNLKEREEIIKYYIKNIKYDKSINFTEVAKTLAKTSGADIESIINNAAINVVSKKDKIVTAKEIYKAYFNKKFSIEGKIKSDEFEDLNTIAIHETGHCVVNYILTNSLPDLLSIKSRSDNLGFMVKSDNGKINMNYSGYLNIIKTHLAGKSAEKYFMKEPSLGSYDDLSKARLDITNLIRCHGYLGTKYMNTGEKINNPMGESSFKMSDTRLLNIEAKEDELFDKLSNEVDKIVKKNATLIKEISAELLDKKIIFKAELQEIIDKINKKKK